MTPDDKNLFVPELGVESLTLRLREEMRRHGSGHTPGPGPALPEVDLSPIRAAISSAAAHADAGARVTPMERIPAPFRWLAVLAGKVVVFLTSFITARQRGFNAETLNSLRLITDTLESEHRQVAPCLCGETLAQTMEGQVVANNELVAQIAGLKSRLVMQERSIALLLEEVRKRHAPVEAPELRAAVAEEEKHLFDAFYVEFEERFRCSRAEVRDRLRGYLPYARQAWESVGGGMLLDLGCGRGEWLDLLRENGLGATGVDMNRLNIAQCRSAGLDAVEGDAIEYLRCLPDNSFAAVTGFHIIEHLPFEMLIRLLDETVRILKPGGMALFESPNPQNVLVGTCNFYYDPTHRNPLPGPTTRFIVESRGLTRVEILNLNPSTAPRIEEDTEVAKRFNEYFYGPMDYAVIGWKPDKTAE